MDADGESLSGTDPASGLLFGIPGNEIPERARAGFFRAPDGRRLRYALFPAIGRPVAGTVILLAGRNECIEKYFETIAGITARGLGVAMFDWRGQGGSERLIRDPQRGHVESFHDYVAELDRFFEEIVLAQCPAPFHILAHSTGGLVALLAAPLFLNRVRRMVLSAPLLSLEGLPVTMRTLKRTTAALYNLGFGATYCGGGPRPREPAPFVSNKLTSDLVRYGRNTRLYQLHPQLALGGPTVSWMLAACKAIETVTDPDFMARIQIPTLFIAAGADKVVSTRATEAYARGLRSGAVLTIDGARHELMQEADVYREQFLAAFHAFVPGADASADES